jgi:aminopeptidase N
VTQFEAIAARQMLPCFDEPDLKATFQVTISRNASLNSMSNMPLQYSQPESVLSQILTFKLDIYIYFIYSADKEGYILDFYPPTPPMSTYLLAIVVSDFTCTTAPSSLYNKSVEACGPPHMVQKNGTFHAAQVSARILDFYEKLWLVTYPLPKMQSVAIPDFEAGIKNNSKFYF